MKNKHGASSQEKFEAYRQLGRAEGVLGVASSCYAAARGCEAGGHDAKARVLSDLGAQLSDQGEDDREDAVQRLWELGEELE